MSIRNRFISIASVAVFAAMSLGHAEEIVATPYAVQNRCVASEPGEEGKARNRDGCWTAKYDEYLDEKIEKLPGYLTGEAPKDIAEVCPNYDRLSASERQVFWRYFFQALASAESGFRKQTRFEEGWSDEDGDPVFSEGLFQLSYSDAKYHRRHCHFDEEKDASLEPSQKSIFNPRNNIQCAAWILNIQLFKKDGELFDKGSYWNVLRRTGRYKGAAAKKAARAKVAACLAKIPGYRPGDLSGIPEAYQHNVAGCQGLLERRILAQFWDDYPKKFTKKTPAPNLCGLKNHLEFCGSLECR